MYRPVVAALIVLASQTPVFAQDQGPQMARSAIMGQLDLLVSGVDEKVAAGDLDTARFEMEYAGAMISAIPWLFPAPTDAQPQDEASNAKPAIWTEFDQFTTLNDSAKMAAEDAAFSSTPEAFVAGFEKMKTVCAACHDKYVKSN
jgi:cytochrome c556